MTGVQTCALPIYATIQAVRGGAVVGSATSAANGAYSIDPLDPASYDVRVTAPGFASEMRQGITVTSTLRTVVDVAMGAPGVVSGSVTQADGITPIAGAAITVSAAGLPQGTARTDGAGAYSVGSLHSGSYMVRAASTGYQTGEVAVLVAENATTTVNFSLSGASAGPALYAYDALGRLIQVTDPSGRSTIYRYDAVGNVIAIERPGAEGSGGVAISGLSPMGGPVGTPVNIAGVGFSAIAADNEVTFNGAAAIVASATPIALVVSVPAGATDGLVAVTNAAG